MSKNTKQDPTPQGRRHFLKSTGIMMGALGGMALGTTCAGAAEVGYHRGCADYWHWLRRISRRH
ncbi:hypothetical protein [Candidatus Symbiopectobacterium sp. 'North America']|uniref:hypothetical protein n=1 Tax=Candidatus Symbiopectobacterium sp. 'North America' TaxID=2794574 RepID=UPI0018CB03BE|nr:hypothetical protein [Candidatus Symbiopectobacterium sp. 'North America']